MIAARKKGLFEKVHRQIDRARSSALERERMSYRDEMEDRGKVLEACFQATVEIRRGRRGTTGRRDYIPRGWK